jgi:hypothetical protein
MDEIDIWRSAHLLIKEYGEEAAFIAAKRSDAFLDQGDPAGFRAWHKIARAIESLQSGKPRDGETVN